MPSFEGCARASSLAALGASRASRTLDHLERRVRQHLRSISGAPAHTPSSAKFPLTFSPRIRSRRSTRRERIECERNNPRVATIVPTPNSLPQRRVATRARNAAALRPPTKRQRRQDPNQFRRPSGGTRIDRGFEALPHEEGWRKPARCMEGGPFGCELAAGILFVRPSQPSPTHPSPTRNALEPPFRQAPQLHTTTHCQFGGTPVRIECPRQ